MSCCPFLAHAPPGKHTSRQQDIHFVAAWRGKHVLGVALVGIYSTLLTVKSPDRPSHHYMKVCLRHQRDQYSDSRDKILGAVIIFHYYDCFKHLFRDWCGRVNKRSATSDQNRLSRDSLSPGSQSLPDIQQPGKLQKAPGILRDEAEGEGVQPGGEGELRIGVGTI